MNLLSAYYTWTSVNVGGGTNLLPGLTQYLAPQLPQLLVYIVGVVLSLVFWKRHPKVSGLTLAAMILLIIVSIGLAWVYAWLPAQFPRRHYSAAQRGDIYLFLSVTSGILHAIGYGILLAAVFSMRSSGQPTYAARQPAQMPPPMPPRYR